MHRRLVVGSILALLLLAAGVRASAGQGIAGTTAQPQSVSPDWLEARGVSLANLVGQIPEEVLHGSILSYGDNAGIVVYESGTRSVNTVVLTTKIYPRVFEAQWAPNGQLTQFGCLGHKPIYDHLGTAVGDTILRVYNSSGTDVTSQIQFMYLERMGVSQPIAGSLSYSRYPSDAYGAGKPNPLPMEPDGLHIPGNGGCQIQIPGKDYYPLTGVFTLDGVQATEASVLRTQTATFQSYIGPGAVGIFTPLMQQLQSSYPDRHGRIPMDPPDGASHFLIRFPAMPGDPYADQSQNGYRNAARLTGSTYRLGDGYVGLSANMTASAALPLDLTWRDQDQAPGEQYLPRLWYPPDLAPPEILIPVGVPYDSCFTQGNCPAGVLEQIYNAVMSVEIFFLSIEPPELGEWVPLRQAGPAWPAGGGEFSPQVRSMTATVGVGGAEPPPGRYNLYLPLVRYSAEDPPPDGCPCGWFDAQGQMLGYYGP